MDSERAKVTIGRWALPRRHIARRAIAFYVLLYSALVMYPGVVEPYDGAWWTRLVAMLTAVASGSVLVWSHLSGEIELSAVEAEVRLARKNQERREHEALERLIRDGRRGIVRGGGSPDDISFTADGRVAPSAREFWGEDENAGPDDFTDYEGGPISVNDPDFPYHYVGGRVYSKDELEDVTGSMTSALRVGLEIEPLPNRKQREIIESGLRERHSDVAAAYSEYLFDPLLAFQFPLVNQVDVEQTATFIEAYTAANRLKTDEPGHLDADALAVYETAVDDLEHAWDVCKAYADHVGIEEIPHEFQRNIQRAIKLLSKAVNYAVGDRERIGLVEGALKLGSDAIAARHIVIDEMCRELGTSPMIALNAAPLHDELHDLAERIAARPTLIQAETLPPLTGETRNG